MAINRIEQRSLFGYNNRLSPFIVPDDTPTKAKNVILEEFGGLRKRKGFSKYNTTAISSNPITSLHRHYEGLGTGANNEMLARVTTGLHKGDDSNGTWSAVTVNGAALLDARNQWATFLDTAIFTNSTNAVKKYTIGGTAEDLGGSPPTSEFITVWGNRVWLAGNATNPSTLNPSQIRTIETWNPAETFTVLEGGNAKITGIAGTPAGLLVWKENSLSLVVGYNRATWQAITLSHNIGCIAPHSIREVNGRWYFLSHDGIYSTNGGPPVLESFPIDGDIRDIKRSNWTDVFALGKGNTLYLLSFRSDVSADTTNKRVLVLDTRLRDLNAPGMGKSGWTFWDNYPLNAGTNWSAGDDEGETYFGSSASDGFVYKLDDGGTDAGANFSIDVDTKFYGNEIEKLFDLFYLDIKADTDFTIAVKYETSQPINAGSFSMPFSFGGGIWDTDDWDTMIWAGDVLQEVRKPHEATAVGRYIQYNFKDSSADTQFTIRGFNATFLPQPEFV